MAKDRFFEFHEAGFDEQLHLSFSSYSCPRSLDQPPELRSSHDFSIPFLLAALFRLTTCLIHLHMCKALLYVDRLLLKSYVKKRHQHGSLGFTVIRPSDKDLVRHRVVVALSSTRIGILHQAKDIRTAVSASVRSQRRCATILIDPVSRHKR